MRALTAFVAILAFAVSIEAQLTATITEINPKRSTFDETDPDGASGGRIHNLSGAANGTTFFAASEWGGLFRSTDTGRTWAHLPGHVPHATWDVAVDPTNANRVFATSMYDGRVNSRAGINLSTDGGTTWTKAATAVPPAGLCESAARREEPAAYGISINPENSRNVVVGTNCGVAISDDGGVQWRFVDPTPRDRGAEDVWDVVVHHGGIIDTCGNDGHRRSTDGGATWTRSSSLPGGRCSIAASPDESYVLFAVVGQTLRESDDGGATWTHTFKNRAPQGRIPFVATNQRTGRAFDLWFGDVGLWRESCQTPATPAIGGTRRCATNDWGDNFTRDFGGHEDTGDIIFAAGVANDACPVLFSSDGGVYFNQRNTSPLCHEPRWEQPDVTPHALWLMGMGGAHHDGIASEGLYFGAQDNGPFATVDAPANAPAWENRGCCDVFDISADAGRVLFTECCYDPPPDNRVRTSGPNMSSILFINQSPQGELGGWRYPDVVGRSAAARYALVSTQGIFVTADIAATPIVWSQLGAATSPAASSAVYVAVSAGTPTFYVQVGEADGRTPDRLFRFSGTSAGDWQEIRPPDNIGGFGIVAVDPNDPNRIVASHLRRDETPRMIMTRNGGASWDVLTALDALMTGGGTFRYQTRRGPTDFTRQDGYPQPTFAAFDPEDGSIIAAGGADSGVFVSIDGGVHWTLVTDPNTPHTSGLPHIPRPRFAYFDHEPTTGPTRLIDLYVGSQGRGVWRIRLNIPG